MVVEQIQSQVRLQSFIQMSLKTLIREMIVHIFVYIKKTVRDIIWVAMSHRLLTVRNAGKTDFQERIL